MFVAENVTPLRMQRCIDFVQNLHKKYNLPIDTELRYEHKVLIQAAFLEEAITGKGFQKDNGQYYIPKIEKTRACLDSIPLRQRFLHGLMAQKQILISGNKVYYKNIQQEAQDNLIKSVALARGVKKVTEKGLGELLFSNGDDVGDLYLGFKGSIKHKSYLKDLCEQMLNSLSSRGLVTRQGISFDLAPLLSSTRKARPQPKYKKGM